MANVLIVEDEPDQAELLSFSLGRANHTTTIVPNGHEALLALAAEPPDIIVLDKMLPDVDGLDLCRTISRDYDIPIVILTACVCSTQDIVHAFDVGAKDYVQKSHTHAELIARINSILNKDSALEIRIHVHKLVLRIDLRRQRFFVADTEVDVTPSEWRLLLCLTGNIGTTVSHKQIMLDVWDQYAVDAEMIKVHVSRLRTKLVHAGLTPNIIRSNYGRGYIFKATAK